MRFEPNPEVVPKHFQIGVEPVNIDVAGDVGYHIAVKGWVLGQSTTTEVVRIRTTGGIVATAPVIVLRPDLIGSHAKNDRLLQADPAVPIGFQLTFSKLLLPPSGDCDLLVGVRDRPDILLGKLSDFAALPDRQFRPSGFRPILIPSMGRSGTTMLAGLLGTHPAIVTAGGPPFEYRFASYQWHLAQVSTAPADAGLSMHPDSFETVHPYSIGYNPYNSRPFLKGLGIEACAQWLQTAWVDDCIQHACRGVNDFYRLVADGVGKPDASAFVEKTVVSPLLNVARNIHPVSHEICLVRDFRDTFCSARQFNKARESQSFGRSDAEDDAEWLRGLARDALRVLATYESRRNHCILVRYEDLVSDMPSELTRLLRHLGVEADDTVVQSMIHTHGNAQPSGDTHRTSASSTESIGRWRRDMSPKEQWIAKELFRDPLLAFGYSLD